MIVELPVIVIMFGITVYEVEESEFPAALTARSLNLYVVPLVNDEIVRVVEVSAGALAVQAEPSFVEYW